MFISNIRKIMMQVISLKEAKTFYAPWVKIDASEKYNNAAQAIQKRMTRDIMNAQLSIKNFSYDDMRHIVDLYLDVDRDVTDNSPVIFNNATLIQYRNFLIRDSSNLISAEWFELKNLVLWIIYYLDVKRQLTSNFDCDCIKKMHMKLISEKPLSFFENGYPADLYIHDRDDIMNGTRGFVISISDFISTRFLTDETTVKRFIHPAPNYISYILLGAAQ